MKTHYLVVPVETADDVTREQALEALNSVLEVGKAGWAEIYPGAESGEWTATDKVVAKSEWGEAV